MKFLTTAALAVLLPIAVHAGDKADREPVRRAYGNEALYQQQLELMREWESDPSNAKIFRSFSEFVLINRYGRIAMDEIAVERDAASGMIVTHHPAAAAREAMDRGGWASVIPMPPLELDHPFDGVLREFRSDAAHMERVCPHTSKALGCARLFRGDCSIWIANDDILEAAGWPYEVVRRHEVGHCNGFPGDHAGARYFIRPVQRAAQ